jgi:hypothetical protein
MVLMARNILDGKWLGPYEQFGHVILSKPPGYPLLLAKTSWLPWAPTVTIHLALLASLILIIKELRQMDISRTRLSFYFLFASMLPIWFNESMSRIYRDGLLAALTVAVIAFSLWLRRLLFEDKAVDHTFWRYTSRVVFPSGLLGLSIGFFLITKPSWHFLIGVVLGIFSSVYFVLKKQILVKRTLLRHLTALALLCLAISVFPQYVKSQNLINYGVKATENFSQGNFADAMKAIYGVKDNRDQPYVDVTRQMRAQIYSISSTMSQLEPYLETPDGQGWRYQPCANGLGVCDESGPWFSWDIRDAVQLAGLGDSAQEFEVTFKQIARDIRNACKTQRIECETEGLAPGLDSLDSLSPRVVTDAFSSATKFLLDPQTGTHQRGEQRNVSKQDEMLWNSTVKGLPMRIFPTQYESNDLFLTDTRLVLISIYKAFWVLFLLISLVGLLLPNPQVSNTAIGFLRWLGGSLILGIFINVFELSLLQGSSGFYVTSGGDLYLLPVFPMLALLMVVGIERIFQIVKVRKSSQ